MLSGSILTIECSLKICLQSLSPISASPRLCVRQSSSPDFGNSHAEPQRRRGLRNRRIDISIPEWFLRFSRTTPYFNDRFQDYNTIVELHYKRYLMPVYLYEIAQPSAIPLRPNTCKWCSKST